MHGFSTLDGFVDITECLAEMIKYVANEPSLGLFYVQQHTQNAVPTVIQHRNKVVDKAHETTLHTEDSEDSITMVRSMKECGFPIADEMIRDIKKSLLIMSTKQPRRGLIHDTRSGFQAERTSSWGSATWGRPGVYGQQDSGKSGYFSTVFKSARKKASNFKWPQLDSGESMQTKDDKLLFYPSRSLSVASVASTGSFQPGAEADELPLSSKTPDEPQEERIDEPQEERIDASSPSPNLIPMSEDYDEFKADKEAKLEEWLEGNGNLDDCRVASDQRQLNFDKL
ncbi:MEF2BNB-like protein [Parasponia andersonii]|uniref:MEF2BNB-like protein n=1 Tax=Parasponia andersonii TaxID=3476 RepID=A0A2P5A8B2_PARAD|nr:MEF2BNB-like protein [Parasponia andersonii]